MPDPSREMVVVEAPWCHNCRAMAPLLAEVASAHPQVALVRVDAAGEPHRVDELGVRGTPTLIGRRFGEERFRATGVRTRVELEELFASLSADGGHPQRRLGRSDAALRAGAGVVLTAAGAAIGAWPLIGVGLGLVGWGAATIMATR